MKVSAALVALAAAHLVSSQAVNFCTDDACDNCPASITTAGKGWPTCVVYDTETVFGGQGFEPGTGGKLIYKVFGDFPDPGPSCTTIIRSPASIGDGCGNLQFRTSDAQCSNGIELQETFLVQFCCGEGDCSAAGVPFKRGIAGHTERGLSSFSGTYLKYANGTVIEPLAVGAADGPAVPVKSRAAVKRDEAAALFKRDCTNYDDAKYVADGEPYLQTFDTQIISASVGPYTEDTTISRMYSQTVETSTSFSTTIGDPFGIVSATVGFEFSESHTEGVQYDVPVPAGATGQIGFTPVYRCTKGKITCGEGSVDGDACTPYTLGGVVQGDYLLVQG